MRRLGDLNLEASEIERGEREQTSADAMQSGEAIKLYTSLLESYPEYRQSDGVLYQLARAYESNGQPEQALDALDRLVSRFGSSALIDEAQFRRGEILFSAKRYPEAERAYAEVIRRGPQSTFFEQSLYKHGWSLFKLARSDESLELVRPAAGPQADRSEGSQQGRGHADLDASRTRAARGHVARHEHHVFVPGWRAVSG